MSCYSFIQEIGKLDILGVGTYCYYILLFGSIDYDLHLFF